MTTRAEHLEFCKKRAIDYCDNGDAMNALISMFSDLNKHPETQNHSAIKIGVQLMMIGSLNTVAEARKFIEGFN